jgi:hypothetical protein
MLRGEYEEDLHRSPDAARVMREQATVFSTPWP